MMTARTLRPRTFACIAQVFREMPVSQDIAVVGWVRHLRAYKDVRFCSLTDGLSARLLEVVVPESLERGQLHVGCAVKVRGKFVKKPSCHSGYNIDADDVEIVASCHLKDYPFAVRKRYPPEYLRQSPHLRPRTASFAAFLRIRSRIKFFLHSYLQRKHFVLIDCPLLTRNDCENAGEAFCLKQDFPVECVGREDSSVSSDISDGFFFGLPVYLTVSSQFHLEAAACGLKNVYTFTSALRAEKSRTREHLAEFTMLEVEMAFVEKLENLLSFVEELLLNVISELLSTNSEDLDICWKYHESSLKHDELRRLLEVKKFSVMSYDEALTFAGISPKSKRLGKNEERAICSYHGNVPVFVTHFPSDQKPFYMKTTEQGRKSLCFDLLLPDVGEACGGSLRESNFNLLSKTLTSTKTIGNLDWYLALRKYGHPQLGGFGLGFERLLQFLLGIKNIRDSVYFPRSYQQCFG